MSIKIKLNQMKIVFCHLQNTVIKIIKQQSSQQRQTIETFFSSQLTLQNLNTVLECVSLDNCSPLDMYFAVSSLT